MKMKLFNMRKKKTKLNKIYIFRSLLIVTLSSLSLTHTHILKSKSFGILLILFVVCESVLNKYN